MAAETPSSQTVPWEQIRSVPMAGGLRAFWDVGGGDRDFKPLRCNSHG